MFLNIIVFKFLNYSVKGGSLAFKREKFLFKSVQLDSSVFNYIFFKFAVNLGRFKFFIFIFFNKNTVGTSKYIKNIIIFYLNPASLNN